MTTENKTERLTQVKAEIERLKVELETTVPRVRELKKDLAAAKAANDDDARKRLIAEFDPLMNARASLKADLALMWAEERQLETGIVQ